ncbi:selenium-dependent molybdenum cofactor biosynthesis protein YqeB [Wukongibacter baidiensis]|uniref:selenium-dependent molybdenum cofactor biosynthesis protein YqeB n=1 Tax=Wukongibacter baidiensis TaxID=1723361 RepID=UPI003D7F768B
MFNGIVVLRGGGDLATGIAHKLFRSGFKILVLEIEKPTMVRRTVSFGEAIFDGQAMVEGVKAIRAYNIEEIFRIWNDGCIPIIVDKECEILDEIDVKVLVDATLAKRNLGTHKEMAPITIGVGPGFDAGIDVDVVIETSRGHDLGKLIFEGSAIPDTGVPGEILGYGRERVLRSPCDGIIENVLKIGDMVKKDQVVAYVNKEEVKATIDGVLRGLVKDELKVKKGLKIGDIDPRGEKEYCYTISDKARAIGGAVLEAILYLNNTKHGV